MGVYTAKEPKKPSGGKRRDPSASCQEGFTGTVVDVLDMSDPSLQQLEAAQFAAPGSATGAGVCRSTHQLHVNSGPAAVEWLVDQIVQLSEANGPVSLLRFHGHGLPGCQFVYGDDILPALAEARKVRPDPKRAELFLYLADLEQHNPRSCKTISFWNLKRISGTLLRLTPCFAPGAEVWLMGCNVAAKREGRQLTQRLALLWGVTVKAGINIQYATDQFSKVRYKYVNYLHEGPIVTGRPTLDPFRR